MDCSGRNYLMGGTSVCVCVNTTKIISYISVLKHIALVPFVERDVSGGEGGWAERGLCFVLCRVSHGAGGKRCGRLGACRCAAQ